MIGEKLEQLKKSQKSGAELAEELAKIIADRAKESSTKIAAEIEQINQFISQHFELTNLENSSHQKINGTLLYNLVAGVPNHYSIEIINHLITQCQDLSGRHDLLWTMIKDRTISGALDMSQTFDLLVEKGLPKPTSEQMAALMRDSRLRQGFNATKLAKSFLSRRQDPSLIKQIIDAPLTRDNAEEKKALEDFLTKGAFTHYFESHVADLVRINSDSLLKNFLKQKKVAKFLQDSVDHSKALNLAAAHKYIETFRILIEADFDPRKHENGAPNCIALACESQGRSTLKFYLKAIKEKFGPEILAEILHEGNSALTHAIAGRAYIDIIKLLLENGASVEQNYLQNLKNLVRKGDAGALEFLLEKANLGQSQISELLELTKSSGNYVVASVFLDYFLKQQPDQQLLLGLRESVEEKHQKLNEKNLFEICKLSGEKTFLAYARNKPKHWLEGHINNRDEENKTALYYAIADNAYNSLVKLLLQSGANPNFIAFEENGQTLNAATLAIRNSESATLSLILRTSKLLPEQILFAAQELTKSENNEAILTKAFVLGLKEEELRNLPLEIRQILLQRSLELGDSELVKKIANSSSKDELASFVEDIFFQALEGTEIDQVKIIVRDLEVKNLLSSQVRKFENDFSKTESEPLLNETKSYGAVEIPNTIFSSSLAQKLNSELSRKYTDRAFEIAAENSENSENAKEIFKILVEAGFETSKSAKEIRSLNIGGKGRSAWCPRLDECCVIS